MTSSAPDQGAHCPPTRAASVETKRMPWRRIRQAAAMTALLALGLPIAPAHAYLDPGTGSILLQALLGGAAGAAVIARLYWHKIATALGIKRKSPEPKDEASARNG
jgi:hypothetical protein